MEPSRLTWRKASYSTTNGGGCVEVATQPARRGRCPRQLRTRTAPLLRIDATPSGATSSPR